MTILEKRFEQSASLLKNTMVNSFLLEMLTKPLPVKSNYEDTGERFSLKQVKEFVAPLLDENGLKFHYVVLDDDSRRVFETDDYNELPFDQEMESAYGDNQFLFEEGMEQTYVMEK